MNLSVRWIQCAAELRVLRTLLKRVIVRLVDGVLFSDEQGYASLDVFYSVIYEDITFIHTRIIRLNRAKLTGHGKA